MLYLLDASVLITANNSYYPVDQIPEYWEWLLHMGQSGRVKIPLEIFEEIKDGPKDAEKDLLFSWIQQDESKKALILDEQVDIANVQTVVITGYGADLTDDEVEQIGRDPFLVAHAMTHKEDRCVVTVEVSKPSKKRHNRHLPDVCKEVGVHWCDPFVLNRDLGFRTNWKKRA
ncbi:DUF4411 family protein [Undibacterium arcticum]|uniref:DUF4411 family protein n=1 Tax=Undibacterium arcticum TaxID=1762892 RepID=A0ABV7F3K6_9BURK